MRRGWKKTGKIQISIVVLIEKAIRGYERWWMMNRITWAERPKTATTGQEVVITDVGVTDEVFRWDGTSWRPKSGQVMLNKIVWDGSAWRSAQDAGGGE